MITKRVSLQGVPGFDNIDFDAWSAQFKNQFENDTIVSITHGGLELIFDIESQIMLKSTETVLKTDGTVNQQSVEMILEREDNAVWRFVQERVSPEEDSMNN